MKIKIVSITLVISLISAFFFASCVDKNNSVEDSDTVSDTVTTQVETSTPETEPPETTAETEAPETEMPVAFREPVENEKAIEMIEYQYNRAVDLIDKIENRSYPTDKENPIQLENGDILYPVIDTGALAELDGASILTLNDMLTYIESIFARKMSDRLTAAAKENFKDHEGVLCLVEKAPEITETGDCADLETDIQAEPTEPSDSEKAETPAIISKEFFLSKFTDKMFRYTAKITYSEYGKTDNAEGKVTEKAEDTTQEDVSNVPLIPDNVEYFDFIFENTGSGWYWTEFPDLPQ